MNRDSASPANSDVLGQIRFLGDNDAAQSTSYAILRSLIADVTDGAEAGQFEIDTRVAGVSRSRMLCTSSATIFNQDGINLDFRVESEDATHCLFVNGATNKVGIKTSSPDGTLHVLSASAGTVTAGTGADELVLENSANGGLSILSAATTAGQIFFGDPDDNNVGMIQYSHSTDHMEFTVAANEAMRISSDGILLVNTSTAVADDMTARACHIASNATTTGPSLIVDDSDSSVESGSICMAVMFSNDNSFSGGKYISFRDLGGEQGLSLIHI